MSALRLFLKDKTGGKQHCLIPSVSSNLGVETFLKKMDYQKRMRYNRGLQHLCVLCIEVSRKFYVKPACLLFFGYKRNSKSFIFFHSLIIEFLWFAYGSNSRKRYTLRLLSNCLVKSTLLPIGGKDPPTLRYLLWFPSMDSFLLYAYVLAKLLQNGEKFIQNCL